MMEDEELSGVFLKGAIEGKIFLIFFVCDMSENNSAVERLHCAQSSNEANKFIGVIFLLQTLHSTLFVGAPF